MFYKSGQKEYLFSLTAEGNKKHIDIYQHIQLSLKYFRDTDVVVKKLIFRTEVSAVSPLVKHLIK